MQSWTAQDRAIVTKVLRQLGLESLAERFYSELSGGEKQRVLIARALAQDTRYIFLMRAFRSWISTTR
jgi:iron complex transport system ATP-binding protein